MSPCGCADLQPRTLTEITQSQIQTQLVGVYDPSRQYRTGDTVIAANGHSYTFLCSPTAAGSAPHSSLDGLHIHCDCAPSGIAPASAGVPPNTITPGALSPPAAGAGAGAAPGSVGAPQLPPAGAGAGAGAGTPTSAPVTTLGSGQPTISPPAGWVSLGDPSVYTTSILYGFPITIAAGKSYICVIEWESKPPIYMSRADFPPFHLVTNPYAIDLSTGHFWYSSNRSHHWIDLGGVISITDGLKRRTFGVEPIRVTHVVADQSELAALTASTGSQERVLVVNEWYVAARS